MWGLLRKLTLAGLFKSVEPASVVLRDERGPSNVRRLIAKYAANGDLEFEGQDIGSGVNTSMGYREYEWTLTIKESDLLNLKRALNARTHLLAAIKARFYGENAILIEEFLKNHSIPFDFWNRLGD
jgi:hypothetical protein